VVKVIIIKIIFKKKKWIYIKKWNESIFYWKYFFTKWLNYYVGKEDGYIVHWSIVGSTFEAIKGDWLDDAILDFPLFTFWIKTSHYFDYR